MSGTILVTNLLVLWFLFTTTCLLGWVGWKLRRGRDEQERWRLRGEWIDLQINKLNEEEERLRERRPPSSA